MDGLYPFTHTGDRPGSVPAAVANQVNNAYIVRMRTLKTNLKNAGFCLAAILPFFMKKEGYVHIEGKLLIDSVYVSTYIDSILVIHGNEVMKKPPELFPRVLDYQMYALKDPPLGYIVFNLTHYKLYMFNGTDWEMINSMPMSSIPY
jgi:hypothetical protein